MGHIIKQLYFMSNYSGKNFLKEDKKIASPWCYRNTYQEILDYESQQGQVLYMYCDMLKPAHIGSWKPIVTFLWNFASHTD